MRTAWPTCARRPTRWWPKSAASARRATPPGSKTLIEGGVGTAFGCTIQGEVEPAEVLRCMQALLDAGADRVSLADTVGYADPARGARPVRAGACRSPATASGAATSTTRAASALANVYAALEVGVARFDACAGRHRRLPARARRQRQRIDRRPGLHARQHGHRHRHRHRRAARAARQGRRLARGRDAARRAVARRPAQDLRPRAAAH